MPLTHITKCLLCDPKSPFTLKESEFEVSPQALNGNVPDRLSQFNMNLLGHIQKGAQWEEKVLRRAMKHQAEQNGPAVDPSQARHLQAWNLFLARVAMAQGFTILGTVETSDPAINQMREMARWKLHESTRKYFFTDDMLRDALVPFQLDPAIQEGLLKLLVQMRDALLEQGKYQPGPESVPVSNLVQLA